MMVILGQASRKIAPGRERDVFQSSQASRKTATPHCERQSRTPKEGRSLLSFDRIYLYATRIRKGKKNYFSNAISDTVQ